jgi:hypothetical protein
MTVFKDGVTENNHPLNLLPDGATPQCDRIPLYEVYMRMAEELAKRSTCAPRASPIGATPPFPVFVAVSIRR